MPQRLLTRIPDISRLCIFVLIFSIAFAGCSRKGPAIAPVKGRVLLDGRPLTTGSVITLPTAGRGAKSFIQHDGTFQLGTFGATDGAIVGEHKVAVVAYERPASAGPESGNGKLLVPQKYTNPESSGLTLDVPPGGKDDVEINLTSVGQKK
jgi:hypothetical protein